MAQRGPDGPLDGGKLAAEFNAEANDLAGRSEEGLTADDYYELERVEKVYR